MLQPLLAGIHLIVRKRTPGPKAVCKRSLWIPLWTCPNGAAVNVAPQERPLVWQAPDTTRHTITVRTNVRAQHLADRVAKGRQRLVVVCHAPHFHFHSSCKLRAVEESVAIDTKCCRSIFARLLPECSIGKRLGVDVARDDPSRRPHHNAVHHCKLASIHRLWRDNNRECFRVVFDQCLGGFGDGGCGDRFVGCGRRSRG